MTELATRTPLTHARTAVFAVFALNGLIMATWISRVPATRDHLDLASSRIGLVLLAMSGGAVLALPLAGAVVTRLGVGRTVRGFACVAVAGLAVFALAPGVPVLVVGLFLMGVGSGTWDVAMNVEGAEVERRLGRAIMPRFHAAFSVGTVTGALIGAGTIALSLTTTVHVLAVAVLALAATLAACGGFLPDEQVHPGDVVRPDDVRPGDIARPDDVVHPDVLPSPDGRGRAAQVKRRHPLAAWREPRTLAIGLLVLTFAFTEGSANDWLALGLVDGYGVSNAHAVLGFALFVTAMTVGRLLGTRVLDRFGRVVVLRITALFAVAGLLLVIVGGSVPLATVGVVLWGLGASLGFPVGMSAAADDPAYAAARVSVVSSIGYTAFLAGPPLVGFLADHVGVLHALWVVLAVLAVAVVVAAAAREQRHEQRLAAP